MQHVAEAINEFVSEQGESIIGHGYERFVSYITTLFLFILLCNLLGLIPGLRCRRPRSSSCRWAARADVPLLPLPRHPRERLRLRQAVSGAGVVALSC